MSDGEGRSDLRCLDSTHALHQIRWEAAVRGAYPCFPPAGSGSPAKALRSHRLQRQLFPNDSACFQLRRRYAPSVGFPPCRTSCLTSLLVRVWMCAVSAKKIGDRRPGPRGYTWHTRKHAWSRRNTDTWCEKRGGGDGSGRGNFRRKWRIAIYSPKARD